MPSASKNTDWNDTVQKYIVWIKGSHPVPTVEKICGKIGEKIVKNSWKNLWENLWKNLWKK